VQRDEHAIIHRQPGRAHEEDQREHGNHQQVGDAARLRVEQHVARHEEVERDVVRPAGHERGAVGEQARDAVERVELDVTRVKYGVAQREAVDQEQQVGHGVEHGEGEGEARRVAPARGQREEGVAEHAPVQQREEVVVGEVWEERERHGGGEENDDKRHDITFYDLNPPYSTVYAVKLGWVR
jgi:hypothetical protein